MKLRRESQKKPERERSQNKEISELKRENHTLKRQLGRLRKQVTYLLDVQGGGTDSDEPSDERSLGGTKSGSLPVCDSCGSNQLATVDLPIGTLVVCKDCKHRKKA